MKPTDFSKYLTEYLTIHLPVHRGFSNNTICSYRDTFVQLLLFMDIKGNKANKLSLKDFTKSIIEEFLDYLENNKRCSISTRNQRLAAIRSFFKYVQYQTPDNMYEFQKIMAIKDKKYLTPFINYLTVDGVKLLMSQPDIASIKGRRDLTIISLMYETGARVSEIANLKVKDIHIEKPYSVCITGKGMKIRLVPIMEDQRNILFRYLQESKLLEVGKMDNPLFENYWGEKFTRAGLTNIVQNYLTKARLIDVSLIPNGLSCHSLRHSRAMHLLQAGIELVYIRDILGHSSIKTTEIYARTDSKQKREAIEKAYVKISPQSEAIWHNNPNILDFLKSF